MKQTTNYLILFSILLYLKFKDNRDNSMILYHRIFFIPVILYLVYKLFKNKNVEGWEGDPDCGNAVVMGNLASPQDIINQINQNAPDFWNNEHTYIRIDANCVPAWNSSHTAFYPDEHSLMGALDSLKSDNNTITIIPGQSNGIDYEIKCSEAITSCVRSSPLPPDTVCNGSPKSPTCGGTSVSAADCTGYFPIEGDSGQGYQCIWANTVGQNSCVKYVSGKESDRICATGPQDPVAQDSGDQMVPPILHCMDGTMDNLINTDDLLDCFSQGSTCGHENCALYHSLYMDNVVNELNTLDSPSDHCSHLLYYGASPNPTMDNGSVIQKIVLKYGNHFSSDINNLEEFEVSVNSASILSENPIFSDTPEDQKLCAKFNALYNSNCLQLGGAGDAGDVVHSRLFRYIHDACSGISSPSPDTFDITNDWLNTMDRYCSIPEDLSPSYDGIPIDDMRHSTYNDFLYLKGGEDKLTKLGKIKGLCSSPYTGRYLLTCNNSISRDHVPLEITRECGAPTEAGTVDPGPQGGSQFDPCSQNPCHSPSPICSPSTSPGGPNGYICSGVGSGGGPSVNPCDSSPCQSDQICSPSPGNPNRYSCSDTSDHTWKIIGFACIVVAFCWTYFRKDKQGRVTGGVGEQFASNSITDKNDWSWAASLFVAPFYLVWRILFEIYLFVLKGRQSQFKNPI